jgi:hypothetical protein
VRNELVFQQRQSEWLLAKLQKVMAGECHQYKSNEQSLLDADIDARQWERFVDITLSKIKISKQCLTPLINTAEHWGIDKVRYYEWASMGWKYCKRLSAAASQNPVWEEALVKLNQLLLRRIAGGRSLGKSANPIYLVDLEHLEAWPDKTDFEKKGRKTYALKHEPITESELPAGYTFDQFGLIVTVQPQPALPVGFQCTITEPKPQYNNEKSSTAAATQPSNRFSKRCSRCPQLLQLVMLMWCLLLAVLSWWYRRM